MKFVNSHMAISKSRFQGHDYALKPNLFIEKAEPSEDEFSFMLQRVGGPWGWDRRPKYQHPADRLPGADYYRLKVGNAVVGYCLTRPLNSVSFAFEGRKVAEIENFGLFPEETNTGKGKTFLALIFKELFEKADTVYLASRSTNHPKVVKFYHDLGMTLLAQETLPDDLLPLRRSQALLQPHYAVK